MKRKIRYGMRNAPEGRKNGGLSLFCGQVDDVAGVFGLSGGIEVFLYV